MRGNSYRFNSRKLAVALAERGMCFSDLIHVTGLGRSTVYTIKRGMTCGEYAAGKICEALRMDPEELLEVVDW